MSEESLVKKKKVSGQVAAVLSTLPATTVQSFTPAEAQWSLGPGQHNWGQQPGLLAGFLACDKQVFWN